MRSQGTGWILALALAPAPLAAQAISLRPEARPTPPSVMHLAQAATAPIISLRPSARPPAMTKVQADIPEVDEAGFRDWVTGFRERALAKGISPQVFDRAFAGVSADPDVIKRDRNQSEFTKTIWDYLGTAVSDLRVENGRKALAENMTLMNGIEAKYGVDKQVVVAIWGLESAYGTFRGSKNVIRSLATLAYESKRGAFFETQLLDALTILQKGDTVPANMTGSWAGAMGHTQFMPGSFLALAQDWNGDGRRDIWSDDPGDALASTAHYLSEHGWQLGLPWGVEVTVPRGFDYALADRKIQKSAAEWAALGIRGADGQPLRDLGPLSLLLPAGHLGAAFLISKNFSVIERYNTADAYVIAVGHLGDRIMGAGPIRSDWPRDDRALTFDERIELQERLTEAGFDTAGVDGRIGPLTINAVRGYQKARGEVPDGYASLRVLSLLR